MQSLQKIQGNFLLYFPFSSINEKFAYIAGYTQAGFPFGITWEEMERFNELESLIEMLEQEEMGEAEKLEQMIDMEKWLAFLAKEENRGK